MMFETSKHVPKAEERCCVFKDKRIKFNLKKVAGNKLNIDANVSDSRKIASRRRFLAAVTFNDELSILALQATIWTLHRSFFRCS